MTKCTICGKEHKHSHISFASGAEIFAECKACCPVCKRYKEIRDAP